MCQEEGTGEGRGGETYLDNSDDGYTLNGAEYTTVLKEQHEQAREK